MKRVSLSMPDDLYEAAVEQAAVEQAATEERNTGSNNGVGSLCRVALRQYLNKRRYKFGSSEGEGPQARGDTDEAGEE